MRKKTTKLRFIFAVVFFVSIVGVAALFALMSLLVPHDAYNEAPGIARLIIMPSLLLLIGFIGEKVVATRVFKPIISLNEGMKEVAAGNFNARLPQNSPILEINEMVSHFNDMSEQLSQTEMLRNDFVSSVSHEFKTPLATIEGYSKMLQKHDLSEAERIEYAAWIEQGVKRLTRMSDNILKISKLDNDAGAFRKETFNLAEQIRDAVISLDESFDHKKIDLDIDLVELKFKGNADLLLQVWVNLLSNAIKFSEPKSKIGIKLYEEGQWLKVEVRDNGIGIAKEAIHHIFDKFYQADSSRSLEGNGLGLALVFRIVKLHGGVINVTSEVGAGSVFTVTLPVK